MLLADSALSSDICHREPRLAVEDCCQMLLKTAVRWSARTSLYFIFTVSLNSISSACWVPWSRCEMMFVQFDLNLSSFSVRLLNSMLSTVTPVPTTTRRQSTQKKTFTDRRRNGASRTALTPEPSVRDCRRRCGRPDAHGSGRLRLLPVGRASASVPLVFIIGFWEGPAGVSLVRDVFRRVASAQVSLVKVAEARTPVPEAPLCLRRRIAINHRVELAPMRQNQPRQFLKFRMPKQIIVDKLKSQGTLGSKDTPVGSLTGLAARPPRRTRSSCSNLALTSAWHNKGHHMAGTCVVIVDRSAIRVQRGRTRRGQHERPPAPKHWSTVPYRCSWTGRAPQSAPAPLWAPH